VQHAHQKGIIHRRANAPNFRHFHTKPAGDTPRPTRLSTASP
jgi:hypothetical protein